MVGGRYWPQTIIIPLFSGVQCPECDGVELGVFGIAPAAQDARRRGPGDHRCGLGFPKPDNRLIEDVSTVDIGDNEDIRITADPSLETFDIADFRKQCQIYRQRPSARTLPNCLRTAMPVRIAASWLLGNFSTFSLADRKAILGMSMRRLFATRIAYFVMATFCGSVGSGITAASDRTSSRG